jgi:copper chaperone CopZ
MGASVVAAILASFCCILPILFALAGVSIVGAAAAFAAWRPYLLGLTFALLGFGFYFAYRPAKQACEPGAVCARPGLGRSGRFALWMVTILVLAFAAFPYYSGPVANLILSEGAPVSVQERDTPKLERAVLAVEGMDCPACASSLESKLKAMPGVSKAHVSYETGKAEVEFDSAKIALTQIENAIQETGFRFRKLS